MDWTKEGALRLMEDEALDFAEGRAQAAGELLERWKLFEPLRAIELSSDEAHLSERPAQEAFAKEEEASWKKAREEDWMRPEIPSAESPEALRPEQAVFSFPKPGASGEKGSARLQGKITFEPGFMNKDFPEAGDGDLALLALRAGAMETARKTREGQWDALALWVSFRARLRALEPRVQALESACAPDPVFAKEGLLAGVPGVVKSIFWVKGEKASAGSKMLSRFVAPIDAPVVAGLRRSGAQILALGKTDEFAMGSDGSRCAFGPAAHPWFEGYLPGGSSSGSAAALSAGMGLFSVGSDTGGSTRTPASLCGLWGLKPSYGALSRFGMVPYAFSLDCPGAFALSAEDLALVFEAMGSGPKGWDEREQLWKGAGFAMGALAWGSSLAAQAQVWKGLRLGFDPAWLEGCDQEAQSAFGAWIEEAIRAGAEVKEVRIKEVKESLWGYYLLAATEAQSSLARYDPARFGWGAEARQMASWEEALRQGRSALIGREAKLRVLTGAMALSEASRESLYAKACALRKRLARGFEEAFSQADFFVSPATPGIPARLGQIRAPETEWAQDRLALPASLAGICALSAPWGERKDGFFQGIQLMVPWGFEKKLIGACVGAQARGLWAGRSARSRLTGEG